MTTPNSSQGQDQVLDALNDLMLSSTDEENPEDEAVFRGSPDDAIDADADGDPEVEDEVDPLGDEDPSVDELDLAEAIEDVDPKGRAAKRIEKLLATNKGHQEDITKLRQEFGQTLHNERQDGAQKMEETHNAMRELAAYTKNLEAKLNRLSEDRQDGDSDAAKFERKIQRGLDPRMRGYVDEAVTPLAREVRAMRQERVVEQKQAATDRILLDFESESKVAVADVLRERVGEEGIEAIGPRAADWFLNGAAAMRKPPTEFGPDFAQLLDDYYKLRRSHEQKGRKVTRERTKGVPPKQRRGAAGAKGEVTPTFSRQEIHDAGYEHYFDAAQDGFKKIKRKAAKG